MSTCSLIGPPCSPSAADIGRIIEPDASDALHVFIGFELLRIGFGVKWTLSQIFRRAKAGFYLHHTHDRQPGHAYSLEDH